MQNKVVITIVGGGPVGLLAAKICEHAGLDYMLIAPTPPPDNRTTALFGGSITLLKNLNIWNELQETAYPLQAMRLIDDTGSFFRAPEVTFKAQEIDLPAFGYNISNSHLNLALQPKNIIPHKVIAYQTGQLTLDDGREISADLVIAADGRNSFVRQQAGIAISETNYPQQALTLYFHHQYAHEHISTEFHTASGPCTLVPMRDHYSSLVWVIKPDQANHLALLSDDELNLAIEKQIHSILGKVIIEGKRQFFPLSLIKPQQITAPQLVLIGEAAHVLPPIGAQGMNLGFRDAAFLYDLMLNPLWLIGSKAFLNRYETDRKSDVMTRSLAVDMLNRSLLTPFFAPNMLRAAGLWGAEKLKPLRKLIMETGLSPQTLPSLMRG